MGAIEPTGVCKESIQSRRGSRTDPTGACGRTRSGKGGGDTELTFARTGTTRSARADGLIQPAGAYGRTRSGKGGGDTELTFARTGTTRSARADGLIQSTGAYGRTRSGKGGGDTELTFARTESIWSRSGGGVAEFPEDCTASGRVEPAGIRTAPTRPRRGYGSSQAWKGLNRQRRYCRGTPCAATSRRCKRRRGHPCIGRDLRSVCDERAQSL